MHYWISGDGRHAGDDLDLPPLLAVVNAHRRLRGPYTAAGTLLRSIGADVLDRCPELAVRHRLAVVTAAPELADRLPPVGTLLEQSTPPEERTRFPSRLHTRCLAHALVELLSGYLTALGDGARSLVVEHADDADPADREFLAVLLRRIPATRLTVVVATRSDRTDGDRLARALERYATRTDRTAPAPAAGVTVGDDELARAYVDGDGVSEDPRERAGYERLTAAEQAQLHDRRAVELAERVALGEFSLTLGALPYHAERGSDPAMAAQVLRRALEHCRGHGLYDTAADLGLRGRTLVDAATQPDMWWAFTNGAATSLSVIGHGERAEQLYEQAWGETTDPVARMKIAYGIAMLYARHHDAARRDPAVARRWLDQAIALASELPDAAQRAYHTVFMQNGLAFVAVQQGRPEEALQLVAGGLDRLERELAPAERAMHRTTLRYNRSQVYAMTGRYAEALADLEAVMAVDAGLADHHLNRGNVLRRLGRPEQALADYQTAIELSPPLPELYYNRADTRLELGDTEGALADFDHVLELDPEYVLAQVGRAAIHADSGQADRAWQDVAAGLAVEPDNVSLLCLQGRLLADRGERDAARQALSAAIRADDRAAEAWATRATVSYADGDLDAATRDLDRAIEVADLPEFRFNRALVHEAAGRLAEATADYAAVLDATDDDEARERLRALAGHATV